MCIVPMVFFVFLAIISPRPRTNKAKQITFEVDAVGFSFEKKEYRFSLYKDSVEYKFSSSDTKTGLSEKIKKGDTVTIKYVKMIYLFEDDFYLIVDARTEDEVFVSIDKWKKQEREDVLEATMLCLLLVSFPASWLTWYIIFLIKNKKRNLGVKLFQIIENIGGRDYRVIKEMDTKLYLKFNAEEQCLWTYTQTEHQYKEKNNGVKRVTDTVKRYNFNKEKTGYLVVYENDEYDIHFYDMHISRQYKKGIFVENISDYVLDLDVFAELIDRYLNDVSG